ncbi:hypothetical protein GG681_14965 [Epibacterium sp. SM1969]|uniref:HTH-type transcriptional regulator MT1864/Rv1816-like C-terminal domain-containing protein n=1 Tax=Tritonibacter aquimaris TaxID=2663379 RepID=A0A844B3I7_9RHOB|nr:TetR-like C-terminal domain-containing protein [Tritonibacter aquimaris]MQY43946.1 hypothetical protein [Tritonibacter aquimaris]
MQVLAARYVDFARNNRLLWISLFEHRPTEAQSIPDWHRQEHAVLIMGIMAPLKRLRPDLDEPGLALKARTTFAAVHGVVLLALQGRFVGVPMASLHQEVSALVAAMTRGAHLADEEQPPKLD